MGPTDPVSPEMKNRLLNSAMDSCFSLCRSHDQLSIAGKQAQVLNKKVPQDDVKVQCLWIMAYAFTASYCMCF